MPSALRELARNIDAFQDRFGRGVSWIMLLMVLVVFSDVIMRYAFNMSSVFAQQVERHLFGLVYLLGVGYTLCSSMSTCAWISSSAGCQTWRAKNSRSVSAGRSHQRLE